MSDLASLTFLNAMLSSPMVLDITLMGDVGDYTVQLALIDNDSLFGKSESLQGAISDAFAKFENKQNKFRN